jgi:hypothetical protein
MRQTHDSLSRLQAAGFNYEDACALRRIAMTLHRWHELECGAEDGAIEREQSFAIERAGAAAADRLRWWDGKQWVRKNDRRTYDEYERARIMQGLPTGRQWDSADFARANAQGFPSLGAWRETGEKPFYRSGHNPKIRYAVADRERGALKRLAAIMARYPGFAHYVQGDPRGAALYILRPSDLNGSPVCLSKPTVASNSDFQAWLSANYSRGIAVHK